MVLSGTLGAFWCVLVLSGTLGAFWCFLALLVRFGAFWCVLVLDEVHDLNVTSLCRTPFMPNTGSSPGYPQMARNGGPLTCT